METDTDGGTIGARAARRRRIRRPPSSARPEVRALWFQVCIQTVTSAGCDFVSCKFHLKRYGTGATFSWLTQKGRFWSEFRCIFFFLLWLTAAGPRVVTPSTTSQLWTTYRRAFAHCRLSREPPAHWDRWSTGNIMRHSYEFSVRLKKMKMSTFELKTKRAFSRFGPAQP